jgi:hypothetical protein
MPMYFIQNRTAQRLFVPPPVNKTFAPRGNANVYIAAADMEVAAIRNMVTSGLISVTASDNQRLSDDLEVPVLSMINGGGGGVASVTGLAPISSSGGANPVISLSGVVSASNGGTGLTSPGAAGSVLTSNGAGGWTTSTIDVPSVNVPLATVAVGDGTGGLTGSTDLAYYAGDLRLEVTSTVSVTNGGDTLTLQPATISTDAGTLTVDAATTVQVGGTGNVSINGQYTLPTADGDAGDVLTTDGAGAASWSSPSTAHEQFDTLVHDLSESNFQEVTYASGFVSAITYWTSAAKTLKIRESLFNYTVDDLISSVVERQFNSAGAQVQQLVHTYNYNPDETLASITTART